jgi:hypothetical protein
VSSKKADKKKDRWGQIKSNIQINHDLGQEKTKRLWELLDRFLNKFTWHKGELSCCKLGEHVVDTQGFFPCMTTSSTLSYWEKIEFKK